jgi:hypothetical protein
VPDTRWVLGAGAHQVYARAQADKNPRVARRTERGVALFVVNRAALLRQALVAPSDNVFDNIPKAGFNRLAFNDYYSAYVRC